MIHFIVEAFLAGVLSLVLGLVGGRPDVPDVRFVYAICNGQLYYGQFNQSLTETLYHLKEDTAFNHLNYYYESPWPGPSPICYGHAMCNPKIWFGYCTDCLRVAAERIVKECPFRIGAQVQLADCRIRYEAYEFNEG